jgi:hypothetical protein
MRDHLAGLDATHVSYSELNTLSQCEEKWRAEYVERIPTQPSLAMRFGTVVHAAIEAWWGQEPDPSGVWDLPNVWEFADQEQVELPDEGPKSYEDAAWLIERYTRVYEPWKAEGWHRANWCSGEFSLDGDVDVPGVGIINVRVTPDDFLVDPDGALVLVERKTMASWQRLELVDVTPQETLQAWAARCSMLEVDRVLFDAIKNYRWALQVPTQKALIEAVPTDVLAPWNPPFEGDVPWAGVPQESKRKTAWAKWAQSQTPGVEAHPPEDSFQAVEVYRDDEQIEGMFNGWLLPILRRRHDLLHRTTAVAVRNIGDGCRRCQHQDGCWSELQFPERGSFVIEDEDE